MRRALAFSLVLGVACAATLGPKLTAYAARAMPDSERLHRDLSAMLESRGFEVGIAERGKYVEHVIARRGDCRIAVTDAHVGGSDVVRFGQNTAEIGPTRFRFGEEWSAGLPRVRPFLENSAQRHLWKLGIDYGYRLVLMIAAGKSCEIDGMPWANAMLYPMGAGRLPAQPPVSE